MPDLLIRDLKPETYELLAKLADRSDRTLEAQVRRILDQAAKVSDVETAKKRMDEIRAKLQGQVLSIDSADLVREIRDHD